MQTYTLRRDFPDLLARAGHTIASFARAAQVGDRTIRAALKPEDYPDRVGGVTAVTAWKLARAWASATGTSDEAAFRALLTSADDAPPAADVQRSALNRSAARPSRRQKRRSRKH